MYFKIIPHNYRPNVPQILSTFVFKMININELHLLVLDILNKNSGQYMAPEEIDRFINLASTDYYNELIGSKNLRKTIYGKDRILDARLNPFKAKVERPVVNGSAEKPVGLKMIREVSYNGTPLRQVEELRFSKLKDNPLADPIIEDPAFADEGASLSIRPTGMDKVTIYYLKEPAKAKWNYTENGRSTEYAADGSIHLEWSESELPQLLFRVGNYLGLPVRDPYLMQVTDKEKQQG